MSRAFFTSWYDAHCALSRVRPQRSRTLDVGWLEPRTLLSAAADPTAPTTIARVINVESTHSHRPNVDLTTPVVTAIATPTTLWPPNHKFVAVTVIGTVTEASGGVPGMVHYQVFDEYRQVQPSGNAEVVNGVYSFIVDLQASRTGQDKNGRLYTIVVTAANQAGNTGSAQTFVVVPHDQGHAVMIPTPTSTPSAPGISLPTGSGNDNGGNNQGNDDGNGNDHGNGNGNDHGNGNGNGNDNGNGNGNGNDNGNGHGHGNGNGNGNGNMKHQDGD